MKKNVLALSIAKMIGGLTLPDATRVHGVLRVTDAGVCHGVVPYYSSQHGCMSVFHVSNTESVRLAPVHAQRRGPP